MKKFLILSFLLSFILSSTASERYASRLTPDGTIFFFMPKKLDKTENIKNFEYDMTCLSWADTVTVNFTFKSEIMTAPSELSISTCGDTYQCTDFKPLFIDFVKGKYMIRITSKFPLSFIEKMIDCPTPPSFIMKQEGKICTATYSDKSWRKERKLLPNIMNVYKYSR